MTLPNTFNELCVLLDNEYKFKNILCIRHTTGGHFLDTLFLERNDVFIKKILYEPCNIKVPKCKNPGPNMLIQHKDLLNTLEKINIKFDLICLDPFHEYYESSNDLLLVTSFLTDNGILVCHDCSPQNKEQSTSHYIQGNWCGVTYCAFIDFAYNNPEWFYAVLNKDFGLGIISKKEIRFVSNKLNKDIQKKFIDIIKNNIDDAYDYFKTHSKEIINLID